MIKQKTPFEGFNIRIPMIIPIKGRGFITQGSTLDLGAYKIKFLWL